MLGYVIAHEVGHLLLGVNSHSAEGLMCAHWRREELRHASLNFFFFTSKDAANLRSRFAAAEYARGECDAIRNPPANKFAMALLRDGDGHAPNQIVTSNPLYGANILLRLRFGPRY